MSELRFCYAAVIPAGEAIRGNQRPPCQVSMAALQGNPRGDLITPCIEYTHLMGDM
jgi:hypothetical protein